MEACLSAHFISRALRQLDHEPWIIPAIYVKPFMKGQKNDYKDAEAIAEASPRPNLRTCVRRHKISWTFRPAIAFDPVWSRDGRQRSIRFEPFLSIKASRSGPDRELRATLSWQF
jgi:hypothetical protein